MAAADRLEVALGGTFSRRGVDSRPGSVLGRATRDTRKVRVGVSSTGMGASSGGVGL